MLRRYLLTIIALLSFQNLYAQDEEALQLAADFKNENAVMTHHTEHLVFKFEDGKLKATTEVEKEILLLTDVATGVYNNMSVYHSLFNKLGEIKGATSIPTSRGNYKTLKAKEIKTQRSGSEGIFFDDGKETTITFTGLEKFAKTSIHYEIETDDIHFIPSFYFQTYVPVAKTIFSVTVPKNVNINYSLHGKNTELIKHSTEEKRNSIIHTWTAENLPRYKTFDDAPNVSYFFPHLILYVADYKTSGEEKPEKIFGTVEDLYRYYYSFVKNINTAKDPNIEKMVSMLTEGISDKKEKAKRIYEWLQGNIKYVAFEDGMGGFIPREAALVCSRKYGDCKDMASLLVAMCRAAGIDAYFTWIGTRNKPYTYKDVPLPVTDDHMICTIHVDDKWIFMDGTDTKIPFGLPPYNIQGKEALVGIGKDEYKIIKVPEVAASENKTTDSTHIFIEDNDLTGKATISLQGYGAWRMAIRMMYQNGNEQEDAVKSITSRGSNKYLQKKYDYKISEDDLKTMTIRSDFKIKDYVQQAGKEYYVNMNLLRSYEKSSIDAKDREVSVENDYKTTTDQVVTLDIPKGYHASYLPEAHEVIHNDLLSFSIKYTNSGKQIILTKHFVMNALYITPAQFIAFNKIIDDLKKQYKESIVLTAAQ